MNKNSKIVVFGASGLVGSAIVRKLTEKGYSKIVGTYNTKKPDFSFYISTNLNPYPLTLTPIDLTNQQAVANFFKEYRPKYVFLAAAKAGGIWANNVYRAEFIYQNIQIQSNVIHQSYLSGVKKLLFLGSTCIYPRDCPQPMKEEYLLTGELEYTNEPYAIAKIAGMKMCESYNLQYGVNFISVMPTNLYGYNDNFDLEKSHVLPALLRKMHLGKCLEDGNFDEIRRDLNKNPIEGVDGKASQKDILKILEKYGIKLLSTTHYSPSAASIEIWGSGNPMREFLWSDDMADACVFLMENINFWDIAKLINPKLPEMDNNSVEPITFVKRGFEIKNTHLNIGTGEDLTIKELAYLIKDIVGFKGEIYFNTSKLDGTPRKVTDVSRIHSLGWRHKVSLEDGIKKLYEWYVGQG